jgi:hypothetical protein
MASEGGIDKEKLSRMDSLFQVALVLLGLLAAAEFQFISSSPDSTMLYVFRITTLPFVILIILWVGKELVKELFGHRNATILTTLFCWDYLSFNLLYYLLLFTGFQTGIASVEFFGGLSIVITIGIVLANTAVWLIYRKIFGPEAQFFKSKRWRVAVILAFTISSVLVLVVMIPI